MARPKTFDQDAALDAAIGVFREHGFEGTSAEMLVGAMKIGRQSLYDTFGDKWRLYRSALARYADHEGQAHRAALKRGPRAIDGLRAMLERVVDEASLACLGVGSICEFGRSREDLNAVNAAAGAALLPAVVEVVRRAQAEGAVAAALDPQDAAEFLLASVAGIRIAARGGAGRDRLEALVSLALRALR